ncbi:hypothetical protein K501DRAFT_338147 [Backusella circina FSU 941]|nr:hypothetical protein K501DRAFT_338147 [Backusella circina FSU 941]
MVTPPQDIANDFDILDIDEFMIKNQPPPPSTQNHLIFMEPNSDLHSNFAWESNSRTTHSNNHQHIIYNPFTSYLNKYIIIIEEQPLQCRISGFGEKDRRPIDPAPILRLMILDENDNPIEDCSFESAFFVIHASLWSIDMTQQYDLIDGPTSSNLIRALSGSLVSSANCLKDQNNKNGYYFAFPDLSIHMTGQYRLQFSFVHLERTEVLTQVFSDPFTVYSAKTYPGMKESSSLSRHLAKQGLKLTVRTQTRSKKEKH